MSILEITLYTICVFFAVIVAGISIYYFINCKSVWRWVKLGYAINMTIIIGLIVLSYTTVVTSLMLALELLLLLSTLLAGSFVSLAKISIIKAQDKHDSTRDHSGSNS